MAQYFQVLLFHNFNLNFLNYIQIAYVSSHAFNTFKENIKCPFQVRCLFNFLFIWN